MLSKGNIMNQVVRQDNQTLLCSICSLSTLAEIIARKILKGCGSREGGKNIFSVVFDLMRLFLDISWETMDDRYQAKTDVLQGLDNTTILLPEHKTLHGVKRVRKSEKQYLTLCTAESWHEFSDAYPLGQHQVVLLGDVPPAGQIQVFVSSRVLPTPFQPQLLLLLLAILKVLVHLLG